MARPSIATDITNIESIGLPERGTTPYSNRNLWQNTPRTALSALFSILPEAGDNKVAQDFNRTLLLSSANAGMIVTEQDHDIEASGDDLMTLRLKTLLRLGYYDDAFHLYISLKEKPHHQNLIQYGLLALLFQGELSDSCLEYKSLESLIDKPVSFFGIFESFCNAALSGTPTTLPPDSSALLQRLMKEEAFKWPYDSKSFERLSLVEKAFLTGKNAIDASIVTADQVPNIPQSHILPLLAQKNLHTDVRTALIIHAVTYDLLGRENLTDHYRLAPLEDNVKTMPMEDIIRDLTPYESLPVLYQRFSKAFSSQEKEAVLLTVLSVTENMPPSSTFPFIADIRRINPETLSLTRVIFLTKAFFLHNRQIPTQWRNYFEKNIGKENFDKDKQILTMLHIIALLTEAGEGINDKVNAALHKKLEDYAGYTENRPDIFNIILDSDTPSDLYKNRIYDNVSDLTSSEDYVMPSYKLLRHYERLGKDGHISEVMFLSSVILNGAERDNYYPGLLHMIKQNWLNVGIKEAFDDLAIMLIFDGLNI